MVRAIFALILIVAVSADQNVFRICVPHQVFDACQELMNQPNDNIKLNCVKGRDRMECLDLVNRREADFLAVDPEDMYVAYHKKNQDYAVFTEFRTVEEPQAEFRYEGIILVKKGSNIHSLTDLRGKKSCHTGYGRNVGYKIPITKLKKHGVFKASTEASLSPVEKELKGLSDMFEKSCLVGKYSPDAEVDAQLKKKYSNLCELCEHPQQCNYPDKFSGYDGAIRCLVENNGDVAFTKTIFVNKYFGLPIGGKPTTKTGKANSDDYEYLCEDGTRRPLNNPCSWAQRPWQGYMGNGDITQRYKKLQERLQRFYTQAKESPKDETKKKLWVDPKYQLVDRDSPILPGDHLIRAQYKDVIERDGTTEYKIKFCVSSEVEMKKCDVMKRAAYSRDIRPEFECILKGKGACAKAVNDGEADVTVLDALEDFKGLHLKAILTEKFHDDDVDVILADKGMSREEIVKSNIEFDTTDLHQMNAALLFNHKREKKVCPNKMTSTPGAPLKVVTAKTLTNINIANKMLLCQDFTMKPFNEYQNCNFEFTAPRKIYVRQNIIQDDLDILKHGMISLSDKFGVDGKIEDVFELFGTFEKGSKDVIFSDTAIKFENIDNNVHDPIEEGMYKTLHCV